MEEDGRITWEALSVRKHLMNKQQGSNSKLQRRSKFQGSRMVRAGSLTVFRVRSVELLWILALGIGSFVPVAFGADVDWTDDRVLSLPPVGARQMRVISPSLLELTLVTTKLPDPARPPEWDFVDANLQLHLPSPVQFRVTVAGDDRDSANHSGGNKNASDGSDGSYAAGGGSTNHGARQTISLQSDGFQPPVRSED